MTDCKLVPVVPTAEMAEAAKDAYMPFGDMNTAIMMAVLAAPAVQGEPVAWQPVDGLRFEYRHPKTGEAYTVSLSREEVMEMMDQELFEKLTACFCECEPIGETNVVDCRCDEYADQFELVTAPQPAEEIGEVVVTKDKLGNIVSVTRQDAEGRVLSVIAESDRCDDDCDAAEQQPDVSGLVEAAEAALGEIECIMQEAYNSAYPVCCGRPGSECCGSPDPEWEEADQRMMDRLAPHQKALRDALAAHRQKEDSQ